jgi:hypothetical protein
MTVTDMIKEDVNLFARNMCSKNIDITTCGYFHILRNVQNLTQKVRDMIVTLYQDETLSEKELRTLWKNFRNLSETTRHNFAGSLRKATTNEASHNKHKQSLIITAKTAEELQEQLEYSKKETAKFSNLYNVAMLQNNQLKNNIEEQKQQIITLDNDYALLKGGSQEKDVMVQLLLKELAMPRKPESFRAALMHAPGD